MSAPKNSDWKDLPKPLNCFTVRSAVLKNLNTGKIVRHYLANTKIVLVQKCVMPNCTYYRTAEAAHHYLNYAFEASAFGLPNEIAPPVHSTRENSLQTSTSKKKPSNRTLSNSAKKQKPTKKVPQSKGGETKAPKGWLKKLLRRKHGKTKNS